MHMRRHLAFVLITRHSPVELKVEMTSIFFFVKWVIWYPKLQPKKSAVMRTTYGSHRSLDEDALEANDCEQVSLMADEECSVEEVAHLLDRISNLVLDCAIFRSRSGFL